MFSFFLIVVLVRLRIPLVKGRELVVVVAVVIVVGFCPHVATVWVVVLRTRVDFHWVGSVYRTHIDRSTYERQASPCGPTHTH